MLAESPREFSLRERRDGTGDPQPTCVRGSRKSAVGGERHSIESDGGYGEVTYN
jgi:hypothetical protein